MRVWQDGMIEPIVEFRDSGGGLCESCKERNGCLTIKREKDTAKAEKRQPRFVYKCEEGYNEGTPEVEFKGGFL